MPGINNPDSINGPGSILGRLAALEKQVRDMKAVNPSKLKTGSAGISGSAWAVSTTSTMKVRATMTVPPGMVSAVVMCVAQVTISNPTTTPDYVLSNIHINGATGAESTTVCPNGQEVTITPAAIQSIDVSSVDTFNIEVWARTGSEAFAASANNMATINAIAIFLKTPVS